MPVAGTLIEGKYEILAKIKEGGMGTIYKVRHRLLDEVRVVKVMRPQIGADEELKRRFTQEAKTATRLKHPNIGAILDFALDSEGMAYIVMEFIDGVNLAELLRASGPPGVPMTLEIAHQTLLALGFLHRKNVVHRDIAPDNLMLTHDDEGRPQVKLIDLGIAKPLDKTINLTSTGVFLGKLKYSSPEQLGGLGEGETLDGRSDLYSLGVALYELLTGQLPFPGESPRELFAAHLFKGALPFSVTDPANRVPEPVRTVVMRAMEKERTRRFASAEEFDREIYSLRQEFGFSSDPETTQRILAKVRDRRDRPRGGGGGDRGPPRDSAKTAEFPGRRSRAPLRTSPDRGRRAGPPPDRRGRSTHASAADRSGAAGSDCRAARLRAGHWPVATDRRERARPGEELAGRRRAGSRARGRGLALATNRRPPPSIRRRLCSGRPRAGPAARHSAPPSASRSCRRRESRRRHLPPRVRHRSQPRPPRSRSPNRHRRSRAGSRPSRPGPKKRKCAMPSRSTSRRRTRSTSRSTPGSTPRSATLGFRGLSRAFARRLSSSRSTGSTSSPRGGAPKSAATRSGWQFLGSAANSLIPDPSGSTSRRSVAPG